MRKTVACVFLCSFALLGVCTAYAGETEHAVRTELARDGRALWPVVIAEQAAERTTKAAADLAEYLGRISGAKFEVKTAAGAAEGLLVGLADEFPEVPFKAKPGPFAREDYLLRSHQKGAYLLGASEPAVEHAVWDLLYRLGYRQFFPGQIWEVLPQERNLGIAVNTRQRPDYYLREIGTPFYFKEWGPALAAWKKRNRLDGYGLASGHTFGTIYKQNQEILDAHPKYMALWQGERGSWQLCSSNPKVRKLIVDWAVKQFEQRPEMPSISLEPCDGAGFCQCEECAAMGSISDRVVTVANEAAEAINRRFKDKYVGLLAYNFHDAPPNIRVHPKVIVSFATAMGRSGLPQEQVIEGWNRQGTSLLGIYDYYSVGLWDHGMPGKARVSNTDYLVKSITDFHKQGVRFMTAESSINFGPYGLGYYLASRMLWDIDEAERVDDLIEDFLAKSFGPAKEPMREFFRLIDGGTKHPVLVEEPLPLDDDRVGRMYRALGEAKQLAKDPRIQARINHLVLYTRYVDLYRKIGGAKANEEFLRHTYRMRETMMVPPKQVYWWFVSRPNRQELAAEGGPSRWMKSDVHFPATEIQSIIEQGIAGHDVFGWEDVEIVDYSSNLVPAGFHYPSAAPGRIEMQGEPLHLWAENGRLPALTITAGLELPKRPFHLHWTLSNRDNQVVERGSVPTDAKPHKASFNTVKTGLYFFEAQTHTRYNIRWEPGAKVTIRSDRHHPRQDKFAGRFNIYFYVPKGTRKVYLWGFREPHSSYPDSIRFPLTYFAMKSQQPIGRDQIQGDKSGQGLCIINVGKGQDGQVWHAVGIVTFGVAFLNVPGYYALHPDGLLLPAEVVNADLDR